LQAGTAKKGPKNDEASRPNRYNHNQQSYSKPVHNIDSDSCGPPEECEKNFGPPHKKETREPLTRDPASTVNEAARQDEAVATAEVHSHTSLHITCIMATTPTTEQKIAPYSSSLKERWSKTTSSLRNNHHPEKSITPCNGLHLTINILRPTPRSFYLKPTKAFKVKLPLIINLTTMP
jgi:hypothetical protein